MEAEAFDKIEQTLLSVYEYLRVELVEELQKQGHSLTGDLINSIDKVIVKGTDFIREDVSFIFYGWFVDTGRRAGGRRVPIDVLEEWIKRKGFESDAKKVRGMAFAIQQTIFDKGISQPTSWKGTDTKGWMTNVLTKNENRIADDIFNTVNDAMDLIITNIVRDTNVKISGNQPNSKTA